MDINSNIEQNLNSVVQFDEFANYKANVTINFASIDNYNNIGTINDISKLNIQETINTDFNVFHMQQNMNELIRLCISLSNSNIIKKDVFFHLFLLDEQNSTCKSLCIDFCTSVQLGSQLVHLNLFDSNDFFRDNIIIPENRPNINENTYNFINQEKVVLYERMKQLGIDNYLNVNTIQLYLLEYNSNQQIPSNHYSIYLYNDVNKELEHVEKLRTQPVKYQTEIKQLENLNVYQRNKNEYYDTIIQTIRNKDTPTFDLNVFFHEVHWQLSNGNDETFFDLNSLFNYFELRNDVMISNVMDATSGKKNVDLLNSRVKIFREYIDTKHYRTLERWKQVFKRDLLFLHNMNKVFSCRGIINIDPNDDKILVSEEHILVGEDKKTKYDHGVEFFFIMQSDGNIFVRFYIPFVNEEDSEQVTIRRFYLWLDKFRDKIIEPYYKTLKNGSNNVDPQIQELINGNALFYTLVQCMKWKHDINLHFDEISYMNLFFDIAKSDNTTDFNPVIYNDILSWIKINDYFLRPVQENNSVETGIILHLKYKNISYYENMEMIYDVMSAYVFKHQKGNKDKETIKNELLKMLKDNYTNKTEQELEEFVNNWLYKYFDNKSKFTKSFSGVDILLSKVSNDYRFYLNGFRNFDDYRHVIFFVHSFFRLYFYRKQIPDIENLIKEQNKSLQRVSAIQGGVKIPYEDELGIDKSLFNNVNPFELKQMFRILNSKKNTRKIKGGAGSNTNSVPSVQEKVQRIIRNNSNNDDDYNNLSTSTSRTKSSPTISQQNTTADASTIEFDGLIPSREGSKYSMSERSSQKSKSSVSSRTLLARYEHEPHVHQHENLLIGQEQSYRGYRIALLTKLDPDVFKNTGKKAYSRFCQVSNGRVPIVIKNDANYKMMLENIEKKGIKDETEQERDKRMKEILRGDERLMTTKKDKLIDGYSLKYRGKHYICPEAWCIKCQVPLLLKNMNILIYNPDLRREITLDEYFKLKINEKKKYPDFQITSGNCPYCNSEIILNEDSKEKLKETQKVLVAKNALGRQGYPGFISKKSHPNELCMVCCFNTPLNKVNKDGGDYFYKNFMTYEGYEGDKIAQDKQHNSYVMPITVEKRIKKKSTATEEIQISLKPCHVHRFGLLPKIINDYLNNHTLLQQYSHITGLPFQKKSEQYYQFLRRGIPWSEGMFSNLMDLMYYYIFDFEILNTYTDEENKRILNKSEKIERIIDYLHKLPNFEKYFNDLDNGLLKYYFKSTKQLFNYLRTNPIWKDEFIFPLMSIPSLLQDETYSTPLFIIFNYEQTATGDIDVHTLQQNVRIMLSHRDFSTRHHIYFIFKRKISNDISSFEEQSWLNGGYNYEPIVFLCKNENENPKTIKLFQYTKFDNMINANTQSNSVSVKSEKFDLIEFLNVNISGFVEWLKTTKDVQEYSDFTQSYMKPRYLIDMNFQFSATWIDIMYRQCAILCTYNEQSLWVPIAPKIYDGLEELVQLRYTIEQQRNTIFTYFQTPQDTFNILKDWFIQKRDSDSIDRNYILIPYKFVVRKLFDKYYITSILTTNYHNTNFTSIPVIPTEINDIQNNSLNIQLYQLVNIRNMLMKIYKKYKNEDIVYLLQKLNKKIQSSPNQLKIEIYQKVIELLEDKQINELNDVIDNYNQRIEELNMNINEHYQIDLSYLDNSNNSDNYLFDYGTVLHYLNREQDIYNDSRILNNQNYINIKYQWRWIKYLFALYFRKLPNYREYSEKFIKKELSQSDKNDFKKIYKKFCTEHIEIYQIENDDDIPNVENIIYSEFIKGTQIDKIKITRESKLIVKFYKYFTENEFFRYPFCSIQWQWDVPSLKKRPTEYEFIYAEWNARILEELSIFKFSVGQ